MILAPTRRQQHGHPAPHALLNRDSGLILLRGGARLAGDESHGQDHVRRCRGPRPWVGMQPTVDRDGRPDGRGVIVASLDGTTEQILWTMP